MDGTWNFKIIPSVVKSDAYKPGSIQKEYELIYQPVGRTPYSFFFTNDRELEYHIKMLQSGLDTK